MQKPFYRKPVRSLHTLGLSGANADVNLYRRDRRGGEPALVWAADYGTPQVVKTLLACGAHVNARNKEGYTALGYAAQNGRMKNLRLLLAFGADVNARDEDGYTALMGVSTIAIARRLLRHGANVNARTKDGWTPLLGAVLSGSPELVDLLLASGAAIQARDAEGNTALLHHTGTLNDFCHEADTEITRILLRGGAQVNDYDADGRTPLWKAVMRLHYGARALDTMRLLLESGAVADDANGASLLAWVKQQKHSEATTLLETWGAR